MPLTFDNQFTSRLPGDSNPTNTRRQVLGAAWSPVEPTPVAAPQVLAVAQDVLEMVGFEPGADKSPDFANVFGGNALMAGMRPYAANYGGHQFGNWAGQLGDGRAISLGEVVNARGERWELQLKGAGPTPFSRTADGRAVLRSSIREFLCSEAMHHLGVPTTRALSVVTTGEAVVRDMFYNGNPREEPGAIVCRVSPSFIRFGNFEIFAARGDMELLAQLVDFTIARDFPHLTGTTDEKRIAWFAEVCERTARLIVHWMRVGFVHGVMNTDNMSILGLTIDYGPYGWVDNFDPTWTPNTTDAQGRRYRFGHQPNIAQWNLVRLAEAIAPLFPPGDHLQAGVDRFADTFVAEYDAMNASKFGLALSEDAKSIMRDGYQLLYDAEVDFTRFFRALGEIPDTLSAPLTIAILGDVFYDDARRDANADAFNQWLQRWHGLALSSGVVFEERRARMHAVNPWFVLRNYVAQQAIDAAESGDPTVVRTLLEVLRNPYDEQPAFAQYAQRRPEWAKTKAGCSMLSCSS